MVKITCDICRAVKPTNERLRDKEWVLGYDIESKSERSLQRAIRFLDRWDDRRIMDLGAIHFCSVECKEEYLQNSAAA